MRPNQYAGRVPEALTPPRARYLPPWLLRVIGCAAGGLLTYFAFAPSTAWYLAIIGLALLGQCLRGRSAWAGAGLGTVFGLTLFVPMLSWSGIYVGSVPWLALAAMEALLVAPSAALMAMASRKLPVWPVFGAGAWVLGETIREVFPFGGFPWGQIAFSQADGPLLPTAALLAASGLSFVTVLCGLAAGELVRQLAARTFAGLLMPVLLTVTPLILALICLPLRVIGADAPTAPIAVIQGNVPKPGLEFNERRRAVLDMHAARTHELAAEVQAGTKPAPRLVIWPENASDIDPYRNSDAATVIDKAAQAIGVPILVGAVVGTDVPQDLWNMGILWEPNGPRQMSAMQTYIKRHPVPFGEYMPYRGFFRLFSDKVDLLKWQYLPGTEPGIFTHDGITLGDLICFEVVYSSLVRDVVADGAQFLVVQTNNATFGYTNETYQQQAMSRIRAVEFGRSVLISATSGVSAVIRPDGSVATSIPLFTPGYAVPEVPLITARTPGSLLGGWIEWALFALTPLALLIVTVRRRKGANS